MTMRIALVFVMSLSQVTQVVAQEPPSEKIRQAAAEANVDARLRIVADAIRGGERSFAAYYLLGNSLRERARAEESLQAYETAEKQAGNDQQRAMSLLRQAEVCRSLGRKSEALARVKRSIGLYAFDEAEKLANELRQSEDKVVGAGQIAAALHTKGIEIEGASVPDESPNPGAIPLPIHFVYNQAEMTPEGRAQAEELGKALQQGFDGAHFLVLGHTDKRGTDQYNLELSRRRGQAVVDFLVSRYGMKPAMFTVEGKGKSELLALGDTEEDHQINRRVEVRQQ